MSIRYIISYVWVRELALFWERVADSACHLFYFVAVLYLSVFPFDFEDLIWI